MYPNRNAIETIKSQFLRVALYTAEGEERERLEKAFPECYSEVNDDLRVPASLIRKKRRENFYEEGWDYFKTEYVNYVAEVEWNLKTLDHFGIPIAFEWSNSRDEAHEAPQEIWDQLVGKKIGSGIEVSYLGTKLLLVFYMNEANEGISDTNIKQPEANHVYSLKFVLPQFIDFNS